MLIAKKNNLIYLKIQSKTLRNMLQRLNIHNVFVIMLINTFISYGIYQDQTY